MEECLLSLLLLCSALLCQVTCFNVDLENYVRHRGDLDSKFGFSVAEHKDKSTSWILVGAPEAQTNQPGVNRGGAVYRCDTNSEFSCQAIPFDETGNNNNSAGQHIDRKSYQWFGATVRSSGPDGVIVACAPRYVYFSTRLDRRDPVGTCFVSRNSFTESVEYSPCRTRNWGHHRQGSCQAGLGATVSKDGQRVFIGAVGSWYWQGQLYDVSTAIRPPYLPPRYQDEFGIGAGQVFAQSLKDRPDVLQTKEGPEIDDDSYLGYSVVAGDFDGSGVPGVAVGMPRGFSLQGKVVIYTWDLQNNQNITGEQLGAYFAYSLCTSDVDGDGFDDLIIGAPLYTDLKNNEDNYENGRVYVVYQGIEEKFNFLHSRDGKNSKGRFGLSLTGLGDINKDGYGDFAVGAPYDGPSERGAVYIYHGSKDGVQEKPSQVIFAEDIEQDITTFGFSLAGGIDLDNNEYPDIVVGAYASETAVFLKSRPVIKVSASLSFNAESKLISLKERNCTTRDGTPVPCLTLTACMEFSGVGVDRRQDFEIQFLLDTKKAKNVRMFFLDHEGRSTQNYSIKLERNKQHCRSEIVYIKSTIRDKLSPLEAELRYSLRTASGFSRSSSVSSGSRRVARSLIPILDQNNAPLERDSINIEKNCGKDNICIPDLKLIAKPSVNQYLLGSGERFEIDVLVENNGEDAFEAMYNLKLPPGMNYVKIERIDDFERDIPVQCSAPSAASNNTLRCDIGNPLPKRKLVHFRVLLSPFHRSGMHSRYEFVMVVNSTNPENKTSTQDNIHAMSIPIWVRTEHLVSGYSYPSEISYNVTKYQTDNISTESDIGPQVAHVYSIKNQGPSDIVEAEAYFVWPSHTKMDEDLLYILEQPQTSGNIRCQQVDSVNSHNIQLETQVKSPLELHGLQVNSISSSGVAVEKATSATLSSSSSSSASGSSHSSHSSHSSSSSSSSSSSGSRTSSSSSGSRTSSSSAGGATGGGSHNQVNKIYDRNTLTGQHGTNTLTDEERRELDLENEEKRISQMSSSGNVLHQGGRAQSGTSNTFTSQSGGGRRVQTNSGQGEDKLQTDANNQNVRTSSSANGGTQGVAFESGSYPGAGGRNQGRGGLSILEEDYGRFGSDNVRTQDSGRGNDYAIGGSRSHDTEHGSRTYQQGGYTSGGSRSQEDSSTYAGGYRSRNQQTGSTSEDGSRTGESRHESGSITHGRGGNQDRHGSAGGGGRVSGEQSYHESRNFTTTFTENDNAPRTYSNYSFVNSSNGNRNISGGWQTGDDDINQLGHIGAGHSGSHETAYNSSRTRTYGNAQRSNLETHSSRNGYNVGNPSSRERSQSGLENIGVYNWTSSANNFGVNNLGTVGSERRRVDNVEHRPRNGNQEPGFSSQEVSRRRQQEPGYSREEVSRRVSNSNVEPGFGRSQIESSRRTSSEIQPHERSESSQESTRTSTKHTVNSRERITDNLLDDVDSKFQLYGRFERSVNNLVNLDEKLQEFEQFARYQNVPEGESRASRSKDDDSMEISEGRQASDEELKGVLDCDATNCKVMKCIVGPLKKDEEVFVGLRFRVWARTLEKISWNRVVKMSTLLAARVTNLPHVGEPHEMKLKTSETFVEVFSSDVPSRPDIVPLWVVVLSACAGALILLLLIFLLYKCGFFKRNRPQEKSAERQPLHNGHHAGDEAL